VEASLTTANAQHGIIVYDDSGAGDVEVDLGGGGQSAGLNAFFGNTLEDLALDIDGAALMAQNNWWGQASGLYQDTPGGGGLKPQIYYGAPINDGLVVHLTFDKEWTDDTFAYDRSGNNNHGTLYGGISDETLIEGAKREAFFFDGVDDRVRITTANGLDTTDRTELTWMISARNLGTHARPFTKVSTHFQTTTTGTGAIMIRAYGDNAIFQEITLNPVIDDNEWRHATGVWDNGLLQGYENGVLIGQNQGPVSKIFSVTPYYDIGYYNHGVCPTQCVGLNQTPDMDDVRIYNRALSAGEVAELHRMNTASTVDFSNHRTSAP
jgi:hypothetical protein